MILDVVVPCYNEVDNLVALCEHLSNCEAMDDVHLIIADSSISNDQTQAFCQRNSITYLKCSRVGRSAQMNEGAQYGSSNLILFLHADVRPPKDFVWQILEACREDKMAGFFAYRFDKKGILLGLNSKFTRFDGLFAGGGDQCQFMTRSLFQSIGMYDESYCIMEDFDMIRRWRKNQVKYKIIRSKAIVSARKYKNHSYWKVNYMNLMAFIMFRRGKKPEKIKAYYTKLLRH